MSASSTISFPDSDLKLPRARPTASACPFFRSRTWSTVRMPLGRPKFWAFCIVYFCVAIASWTLDPINSNLLKPRIPVPMSLICST